MRVSRSLRQAPSLVISVLALLIALSGTSVAAIALAKGQVKTKHLDKAAVSTSKIKKGAVNSKKIAKNSIDSAKVKNGTLRARDFRAGELPAGDQGPAGPAGPVGAPAVIDRLDQGTATSLAPLGCYALSATGADADQAKGTIVSGWLSTGTGGAAVGNGVGVVPGARNLSTQGGSLASVLVCNFTQYTKNLPAGWKFNRVDYPVP